MATARSDADANAVLAQERAALEFWSQGRTRQYFAHWADDATYFDDLGAARRVDGRAALTAYVATLDGKVPPHRYELVEPKVQMHGDLAIVTFRYDPFGDDGTPGQRWKATVVAVPAAPGKSSTATGRR